MGIGRFTFKGAPGTSKIRACFAKGCPVELGKTIFRWTLVNLGMLENVITVRFEDEVLANQ
jgi:hypothetical protein